jgi:hypothetical protein
MLYTQIALRVLGSVQQDELYETCAETIAVLTAPEAVYVWQGNKADAKQYAVILEVCHKCI